MAFTFEMKKIARPGWNVVVDGEEIQVSLLELQHPKFGKLVYGQRPEGYDAWVYFEPGGGGAITFPYFLYEDEVYVGILPEKRVNMGEKKVLCAMGGFVDPGETHAQTQIRESDEESGLDTSKAVLLEGSALNVNRAFWVTDPENDEGVHIYAFELSFKEMREVKNGGHYILRQDSGLQDVGKIGHLIFLPWKKAVQRSPDALVSAGIARLLAKLT